MPEPPLNMHGTNAIWCDGEHNSPGAFPWGDKPLRDYDSKSSKRLRHEHASLQYAHDG